jgi:hypothetical protein
MPTTAKPAIPSRGLLVEVGASAPGPLESGSIRTRSPTFKSDGSTLVAPPVSTVTVSPVESTEVIRPVTGVAVKDDWAQAAPAIESAMTSPKVIDALLIYFARASSRSRRLRRKTSSDSWTSPLQELRHRRFGFSVTIRSSFMIERTPVTERVA